MEKEKIIHFFLVFMGWGMQRKSRKKKQKRYWKKKKNQTNVNSELERERERRGGIWEISIMRHKGRSLQIPFWHLHFSAILFCYICLFFFFLYIYIIKWHIFNFLGGGGVLYKFFYSFFFFFSFFFILLFFCLFLGFFCWEGVDFFFFFFFSVLYLFLDCRTSNKQFQSSLKKKNK